MPTTCFVGNPAFVVPGPIRLLSMRVALVVAALGLLAGCGGSSSTDGGSQTRSHGTATLAALCPQVHQALDALVVSNPEAQGTFVAALQRIADAGTEESQLALAPLLAAAKTLQQAGNGPAYGTAMPGIHPAVVTLDGACVRAGSPILHGEH